MPNKIITLQFEINERGHIRAIYGRDLPSDYIAAIIKTAQAEIDNGILFDTAAADPAQLISPGDKFLKDVNYILNDGGHIANLPSEDL